LSPSTTIDPGTITKGFASRTSFGLVDRLGVVGSGTMKVLLGWGRDMESSSPFGISVNVLHGARQKSRHPNTAPIRAPALAWPLAGAEPHNPLRTWRQNADTCARRARSAPRGSPRKCYGEYAREIHPIDHKRGIK
jgi:hypothetical protein